MRRLAVVAQRVVLRTADGPLRPVWALAYAIAIRALALVLGTARRGAAVYACGSFGYGEPVYGVSDIDLVVVTPEAPSGPGAARAAVDRRWRRFAAAVPILDEAVDVAVYEQPALADAVAGSTITYGLEARGRPPSAYFGPRACAASVALREGPGLFGPMRGWRRVRGPERRPPAPDHDRDQRRIAAWLALQSWWRWTFLACLDPTRPWVAQHSAKLVAEPVRILLWLRHGEVVLGRTELRRRATRLVPEQADALARLEQVRGEEAGPGLAEALSSLVALSARIGSCIGEDVEPAGTTEVRLLGTADELLLSRAAEGAAARFPARWGGARLPLVDWRARAYPWFVDEAFTPAPGDPAAPAAVAEAARAARTGPYVALAAEGLLVLPTAELSIGRGRLRGVQCPTTDPVSFAVCERREIARFPGVAGWSARDCARRAVAEHAGCLCEPGQDRAPDALAKGLNAARAGLFRESVEKGEPELALTVAATLRRLSERSAEAEDAAGEARRAYTAWRLEGRQPPEATASRLHRAVRALPAYRPWATD